MPHFRPLSSDPAFIIGVTGHMDLDPRHSEKIKKSLKHVFDWVRDSSKKKDKELGHAGLGLTHSPIILLSSLAPGADQWAVEVAREVAKEAKQKGGVQVLAPLPFLKDQYLQASTFVTRFGVDERAKEFCAEFPDEETFVVRLIEEVDDDEATLHEKHAPILTGPDRKADRDRRYLAAGEYVAAYSDILLALTDGPIERIESAALIQGESPSAKGIAERKLRGLMFGLLPTSPALSGSDSGPVIHIYAPRIPKTNGVSPSTDAGKMEILFQDDCRPEKVDPADYANGSWQKEGYATLHEVALNFERLSAEQAIANDEAIKKEFFEMLPDTDDALLAALSTPDKIGSLGETLMYLAGLRRRVADCNRDYDSRVKRLRRTLFLLAFFSALLFAFAENWMPARDTDSTRQLRAGCLVTAVLSTLASWGVFMLHRARLHDQRSDDYRAIAEGLRVQFYWTACGSGESVASNYLQRQREEVGWIRCVISAAAFPYEPARFLFKSLSPKDRWTLLSAIRKGWVKKQLEYFTVNVDKLITQQRFFVHYSTIMLLAAFVLYVLIFCFQNPFACQFLFHHSTPIVTRSEGLALCGAAIAIFFVFYLIGRRRNVIPSKPRRKLPPTIDRVLSSLFSFFSMFLPKRLEPVCGGKYLIRVGLFVAATLLAIGIAYCVRGIETWIPAPVKILALLRNLLLAGGVLCGLWVGANYLTENKLRYASMKSMFKGVDERFGEYLAACTGSDPEERVFADIRALIIAGGREALSENADWLFTHRIRPVEVVST